jgi:hypothetical protein
MALSNTESSFTSIVVVHLVSTVLRIESHTNLRSDQSLTNFINHLL